MRLDMECASVQRDFGGSDRPNASLYSALITVIYVLSLLFSVSRKVVALERRWEVMEVRLLFYELGMNISYMIAD